jgi:hypothetical protein
MKGQFLKKPEIRKLVEEARRTLGEAGVEINCVENLSYALNWDHSFEYARSVTNRLRQAKADVGFTGTLKQNVVKALDEMKDVLNAGRKYRYPP